jgi:predicted O-methyltransferase YrrM
MAPGGTRAYDAEVGLPAAVSAAVDLARGVAFDLSCRPEQGRLLAVLAGGRRGGLIGEVGTGCGVGVAWLTSGGGTGTRVVSIELDEARAAAAAGLYASNPDVEVLHGDWTELEPHGPFDLLVLDGGPASAKAPGTAAQAPDPERWLRPGGSVVIDDLTPGTPVERDPCRSHWLDHPVLDATELRLADDLAAIVATRRV